MRTLLIILYAIFSISVESQDRIELDIVTLLEIAQTKNPILEMIQLKEEKAKAELNHEKNWWLPTLILDANAHQLWGNAINSDGRIFTDVDRQSFGSAIGINTYIDLQDGRKHKKLREYELRSRSFLGQIERNEYILELISVYYNYIGVELEKAAYQQLIVQSADIIKQLGVLVTQGLQYNTDLLLAKANVEDQKYQYQRASMEAIELESSLLTLLYKDANSDIVLIDSLLVPIILVTETELDSVSKSTHPFILYTENILSAKEFEYNNLKKGLFLPKFRLSAYTGTYGDFVFDQAPTSAINGGVSWEIPLSRLSGAKVKALDIEKRLLEKEVQMKTNEMDNNIHRLQQKVKANQVQIESTEQAIKLGQEALGETISRQQLGLSRPFEIELAQEAFINANINYLQAVANHNITQYELFVALGNNL